MLKSKTLIAPFAAVLGIAGLLMAAAPSYAHTDAELQQIMEQFRSNDYRGD